MFGAKGLNRTEISQKLQRVANQRTDISQVRLLRLATRAAVAVAGLLIIMKMAAWFLTDSVAILSSLMDSVLDLGASLVNICLLYTSPSPRD